MKRVILLILLPLATNAQPLFTDIEVSTDRTNVFEQSSITARINAELLLNKTSEFEIDLPNGIKVTAILKNFKKRQGKNYSWRGHIKSEPEEQIVISHVKGAYSGAIYTKNATYEIMPTKQLGKVRVTMLNTDAFDDCDGEEDIKHIIDNNDSKNNQKNNNRGGVPSIDVMVLYTPQARDAAGGAAQIEAVAQAAVDAMNISFTNSQVTGQVNLSYTGFINYNDSGDSGDDLEWVANDSQVALLRNAFGADLVALFVNNIGGCGRGYVMRNPGPGFESAAFQVTRRDCAVGNLSFAHEYGHNLGLEHNPENSGATPAQASNPWSYGHYHDGSYRTVMSYSAQCNSGCTRRQYFSNPDIQFNNLDTGIEDERDNARTLGQTIDIAVDFRVPNNDIIFENSYE